MLVVFTFITKSVPLLLFDYLFCITCIFHHDYSTIVCLLVYVTFLSKEADLFSNKSMELGSSQ
jgi:hypothetical protein